MQQNLEIIFKGIDKHYPIIIDSFNWDLFVSKLEGLGKKGLIISQRNIYKLYGEDINKKLQLNGYEIFTALIKTGEKFKELNTIKQLYSMAAQSHLERDSFIIGLGGGIVLDISGFVASTYLRGINFINIPTSLVAMVDASIGGKTGFNLKYGKNLIGTYAHPYFVWLNPYCLKSLPVKELCSGLAEIIKIAFIYDPEFFYLLQENIHFCLTTGIPILEKIIFKACELKARIVMQDEKEKDLRKILNFGHTIGHALETITGYSRLLHGEAVAIGMVYASKIALKLGILPLNDFNALLNLIKQAGLPYSLPSDINIEALIHTLWWDKKIKNQRLHFVLPTKIGEFIIYEFTDLDLLKKIFTESASG